MKKRIQCLVSLPFILLASLSIDAHAGEFRVENASGSELVTFFQTGDIHVALGDIREGENAILARNASTSEFVVENSAGNVILRIPDDTGDLHIAGTIQQQLPGPLVPPPHSFVIQNTTGQVVTYVDTSGNLSTKGRIFLHGRPVQRVKGGGHWGGHSVDVNFSSFSSSPGRSISDEITLDREAFIQGGKLVLADTLNAQPPFSNDVEVGAAWLNERFPLDQGFRIEFDFTVTAGGYNPSTGLGTGNSAAGFALVFQNQSAHPPLHSGLSSDCPNTNCEGEIGYSGLTNAVAIEFDASYSPGTDLLSFRDSVSIHANGASNNCTILNVSESLCQRNRWLGQGNDFELNGIPRLKGTHHVTIVHEVHDWGSEWRFEIDNYGMVGSNPYILEHLGSNTGWIGFVGAASRNAGLLHRTEIHNFSFKVLRPLLIGISGERGISVSASGELWQSGINALLNCIDTDEIAVEYFSEEGIYGDGGGPIWEHFLKPTLERQTGSFKYALMGHSHGGGDVFLLSQKIDEEDVDPFSMMTIYVDAIQSNVELNSLAETRRPLLSQYHVNLYQTSNLLLHGAPTTGTVNLNLDINSTTCVEGVGHGFIDNCVVTQRILTTHLRNWLYQEPVLTPAQICAQEGSYCDANSEDHVCTP